MREGDCFYVMIVYCINFPFDPNSFPPKMVVFRCQNLGACPDLFAVHRSVQVSLGTAQIFDCEPFQRTPIIGDEEGGTCSPHPKSSPLKDLMIGSAASFGMHYAQFPWEMFKR